VQIFKAQERPVVTGRAQDLQAAAGDRAAIEAAVEMIAAAERPILYTGGGGIINSGSGGDAIKVLNSPDRAPVTSTLMGLAHAQRAASAIPRHAGDAWQSWRGYQWR
jgi:acetolactate synthase-1/2/3 large subunit